MKFVPLFFAPAPRPVGLCLCYRCVEIVGRYNVDGSQISVSGISGGGMMSTQMHVAYSSVIMGAGIIAGGTVQRRRTAIYCVHTSRFRIL